MKIKQRSAGNVMKRKYSQIKDNDTYVNATNPQSSGYLAVGMLLANGYAIMNSYNINEINKMIRSLRELGVEYTMKTIESQQEYSSGDRKWRDFFYEFTTVFFEDDRK